MLPVLSIANVANGSERDEDGIERRRGREGEREGER